VSPKSPIDESSGRVRYVLVGTSHPGNIGAAARAIRTMGFRRLVLVAPQRYPDPQVTALASGAVDVLEGIQVHADLDTALADASLVLGMSARRRGVTLPEHDPRSAAARVREAVLAREEVAFVFGNEQSGLSSEDLARCHAMVRIPSVDDFSSLNLAQAVQVQAYEMRMALLGALPSPPPPRDAPASAADMEHFYAHLLQTLDDIDFHKGRSPRTIEKRLRKLFQRARPDTRELRVLHGILADAQRMAELGRRS
jgi:tRNA (cytidine32/uridine32-2'-O)-methyltransferase